ncbi:hypothetical protein [Sigmofec virus UA08Rod_5838]|uniref:Uncharacterized protein n=1 Tax=Sigmofec virus UA08Rod_5838 TaxID=2929442 RepID=A0A976R586_9VIRU|nr:hypothetical protein [Sigmofec virus UA08Rod_5838]
MSKKKLENLDDYFGFNSSVSDVLVSNLSVSDVSVSDVLVSRFNDLKGIAVKFFDNRNYVRFRCAFSRMLELLYLASITSLVPCDICFDLFGQVDELIEVYLCNI